MSDCRSTCDCGWTSKPCSPKQAAFALRIHSCDLYRARLARAERVAARKNASGPVRDCTHPIAEHKHGTYTAYVADRCRCRPCTDARAAYEATRRKQQVYGRWNGLIDAEPARRHVLTLRAAGMGPKTIAAASGVPHGALAKLIYGDPQRDMPPSRRIRPATEAKILAVTPALAPGATVDATGTRRRLQALVALGWTQTHLAGRLDMQIASLGRIVHGCNAKVTTATAQAVAVLYDELSMTAGPSSRARTVAATHRWVPPLAWDDESIDNPKARPRGTGPVSGAARREALIADVEELLAAGRGFGEIAHRLRYSKPRYLARALYRYGRSDLAAHFHDQRRASEAPSPTRPTRRSSSPPTSGRPGSTPTATRPDTSASKSTRSRRPAMSEQPLTLSVLHDCVIDGQTVRHTAPVDITEVLAVTLGTRYRGTRCDGTAIEWVEPR